MLLNIVENVQYLPSVFYTCFSDSAVNFMSTITLEHAYITVCQWNTCDVFVYIWLTNQSRATLLCHADTWHFIVNMHHVELWCWTEFQKEYDILLQVILALISMIFFVNMISIKFSRYSVSIFSKDYVNFSEVNNLYIWIKLHV